MTLVAICVVAGFIVSGPPLHERFVRYDDARVADLTNVQNRILSYWHIKQALPDDIIAVEHLSNASGLPKDPGTGTLYEYYIVDPHTFDLCAHFRTKSPTISTWNRTYIHGWGWEHNAGRSCYQRDVNLFPARLSPQS
jgi:hypothetical protein